MERLFHRHAKRHLNEMLITSILENGPQKKADNKPSRNQEPRLAHTYRGARRNFARLNNEAMERRGPAATKPMFAPSAVKLNRSQHWKFAKTYAQARAMSPRPLRIVT